MTELTVLSMGWGKQTVAMAAMMAFGDLPKADFLVFADTGHELQSTYTYIRDWTPFFEKHGLTLVTVHADNTEVVRADWGRGSIMIPAFSRDSVMDSFGQIRRQCTHDWKITPIRRFIAAELKRRELKKSKEIVESWQGISWDEALRMRKSDVLYIKNRYPLVEQRLSRSDCVRYLATHGLPEPPKSACTFCPFTSLETWRGRKKENTADWEEAINVDDAIRHLRPKHRLFVHPYRRVLAQAVEIPEDHGATQPTLQGFDELCDGGYCGV